MCDYICIPMDGKEDQERGDEVWYWLLAYDIMAAMLVMHLQRNILGQNLSESKTVRKY